MSSWALYYVINCLRKKDGKESGEIHSHRANVLQMGSFRLAFISQVIEATAAHGHFRPASLPLPHIPGAAGLLSWKSNYPRQSPCSRCVIGNACKVCALCRWLLSPGS